ncbi:hypothetical protein HZH68_000034 [Vespula germanica]|uniref:Uncharacterized protein n=1 Tax=Vespula germanica TaxID=30212 RepID=A0A834NSY9_VESGE|nr:hypothetical protein HZH68_000034 [Vespula germanica]
MPFCFGSFRLIRKLETNENAYEILLTKNSSVHTVSFRHLETRPVVSISQNSKRSPRFSKSPNDEKFSKSTRGDKFSMSQNDEKISKSTHEDRFLKFSKDTKISKSTRGDRFSKSPNDEKFSMSTRGDKFSMSPTDATISKFTGRSPTHN